MLGELIVKAQAEPHDGIRELKLAVIKNMLKDVPRYNEECANLTCVPAKIALNLLTLRMFELNLSIKDHRSKGAEFVLLQELYTKICKAEKEFLQGMKKIKGENVQSDYIESLQKNYLSWKEKYEFFMSERNRISNDRVKRLYLMMSTRFDNEANEQTNLFKSLYGVDGNDEDLLGDEAIYFRAFVLECDRLISKRDELAGK